MCRGPHSKLGGLLCPDKDKNRRDSLSARIRLQGVRGSGSRDYGRRNIVANSRPPPSCPTPGHLFPQSLGSSSICCRDRSASQRIFVTSKCRLLEMSKLICLNQAICWLCRVKIHWLSSACHLPDSKFGISLFCQLWSKDVNSHNRVEHRRACDLQRVKHLVISEKASEGVRPPGSIRHSTDRK